MAKLTEGKLAKLKIMAVNGFSNKEIARAIGVSDETVRKFRSGGNKNVQNGDVKKGRGSSEIDKQRGAGDSSDTISQKRSREPKHNREGDHAVGESTTSEGSAGDLGSKRIDFVGGKKSMKKKTEDAEDGEKDWTCPECGEDFNGQPETCPHCGAELEF